jgi:beta-glucosidase
MTQYAPEKGLSPIEAKVRVEAVIAEATLEEKVAMMSGKGFFTQYMMSGRRWGGQPYQAWGRPWPFDVFSLFDGAWGQL